MAKKKVKEYTFVRGAMPTVVWDRERNRTLAEFCDPESKKVTGIFVTTDKRTAGILRNLGYKETKDFPDGAPRSGFKEIPPLPPTHKTPGGPDPIDKSDIKVDETVTEKTLPEKKTVKKPIRRRK